MAQTKVSALTAKTTPAGTEELLINDGGTSKKITIANAVKATDLPTAPSGISDDTNKEYNLKLTDVGGTETLTWVEETDDDTTYSNFTGDSGSGGAAGLVPAPGAGDTAAGKYLDADGSFTVPPDTDTNTTYTAGDLLDLDGTEFDVDLSELTDGTDDVVGSEDELVYLDNSSQKRKLISEIKLGQFNNDQSWINDVVDDTSPQLGGELDCNGNQIQWSQGADVASATALAVLTDGNYFDVTGTTTITSINTTGGVGTLIKLHFDGILTLTHHATDLILPGGANITTAAGDEAEFIEYASGDYRCTNYSKASGEAVVSSGSFDPDGAVTINDTGADVDFRVEGSGAANALFVQGSDGNVGIGTGTPSHPLDVTGRIQATEDGAGIILRAEGTGSDEYSGIAFKLQDTASTWWTSGAINVTKEQSWTATASTRDSKMTLRVVENDAWVDALELTSDGDAKVNNGNLVIGTAGKGIDFSAATDAGGMTSELLDDYEEGTFTPALWGNSTAGNTAYASQVGFYEKIGRTVHIRGSIEVSSKGTIDGLVFVTGLPFTANATTNRSCIHLGYADHFSITASESISGTVMGNDTTFLLRVWGDTGGTVNMDDARLSDSSDFYFSGTYYV
jgi:hypothetical protein